MTNSPRQTTSFLMRRFEEAGLRPDKRRGQNFLTDLNLVRFLADAADLSDRDVVLEVGTGLGSLTTLLAERAGAVITVEVDPYLQQLASEVLVDFTNITMLRQDALRNKNNLHPEVIAAVQAELDRDPRRQLKLAANLPYNIATPVVSNLLSTPFIPVSMTVTIQKELAERMTARPSTKDYSALSIWIQSQCDAQILRVMPPDVFWPRPKVDSAILQIISRPEKRSRIPDLDFFHTFVRALFFHRRKFLRSVVLSSMKDRLTKPQADEILSSLGFDSTARAEELDIEQILALSEAVRQTVASSDPT